MASESHEKALKASKNPPKGAPKGPGTSIYGDERNEYRSHSSNRVFAYFSSDDDMDSGVSDGLPSPPQSPQASRTHRKISSASYQASRDQASSPSCSPRGTSSPIACMRRDDAPRETSSPRVRREGTRADSPEGLRRGAGSPTCLRKEDDCSPSSRADKKSAAGEDVDGALRRSAGWRSEIRKTSDTALMKLQNQVTQFFRKKSTS